VVCVRNDWFRRTEWEPISGVVVVCSRSGTGRSFVRDGNTGIHPLGMVVVVEDLQSSNTMGGGGGDTCAPLLLEITAKPEIVAP
jgi:hypothetical protein